MAERFELFRIPVLSRSQPDLYADIDLSREAFLRRVFGTSYRFQHYGTEFHYVPDAERPSEWAVMGRLARQVVSSENLPPEQGFEDTIHPGWKTALIIVDPREHEDGQKVAVQVQRQVGTPKSLITGLVKAINQANPHANYITEVQPIFDAQSFWRFADEHRGNVVSLTFEFTPPNGLWNTNTSAKDEMRDFREALNAESVTNTFKSEDGINTDSDRIKDAVEYAEKGSGKIRATARNKKRFSSTKRIKRATLAEIEGQESEPLIVRAAKRIAEIFQP